MYQYVKRKISPFFPNIIAEDMNKNIKILIAFTSLE